MPIILQVIICSLIGGIFSLLGGIALSMSRRRARLADYATAFAAGALLAAAFIDLLPEALESTTDTPLILISTLIGMLIFFALEGALNWFHRHAYSPAEKKSSHPIVPMLIIGDTIHNFIDGIAIASGFLISPTSGIIVTFAIAAHEIPQEIGDFGVMLSSGLKRRKVILINIASAFATTISAVIFYLLGTASEISFAPLLAIVAGFFIYIAMSDIIPTIHREKQKSTVIKKSLTLFFAIILVATAITTLHQISHEYSGHTHNEEESHAHAHEEDEEESHDHAHEDEEEESHATSDHED